MSSNSRYQVLQNEEEDATSSSPATLPVEVANQEASPSSSSVPPDQPPPYIADGDRNPVVEFSNEPPPQYTDVVKLPTYNESENNHDSNREEIEHSNDHRSVFFYWLNNDVYNQIDDSAHDVGSDASFMFSFLLSLIFNWIGFLISYCFTNNLASYYGAISGFGISLVKWAFIAKISLPLVSTCTREKNQYDKKTHGAKDSNEPKRIMKKSSNWSKDFMMENPWFCYAFVLFGWVIFMRGIFAYIQLKRLTNQQHYTTNEETNCSFFG